MTEGAPVTGLSAKRSAGRQAWALSVAVFITAMLVRLSFLSGTPDRSWPHSVAFEGDAPLYARWAQAIRDGAAFEFDLPVHSPGMAYLLAPMIGSAHPNKFLYLKLFLALVGSASCMLIARLASDAFGSRVGVLSGLLSAASFGLIVQCSSLNSEPLYTLSLLLILWRTPRLLHGRSFWLAAALGALHGVAALLRAEHTVMFAMWLSFLAWHWLRRRAQVPCGSPTNADSRRSSLALLGTLGVVFFLVPLPWNIRSYRAINRFNTTQPRPIPYHEMAVPWSDGAKDVISRLPAFAREGNVRRLSRLAWQRGRKEVSAEFVSDWFRTEAGYVPRPLSPFVFISHQGALSFALANHAHADGGFSTRLLDTVMDAPPPQGHVSVNDFAFANPRHLRLYQEGYWIGWNYLRSNPRAASALLWKKLTIFVAGLASGFGPTNAPLGNAGTRRPVDQFTVTWESLASRPWAVLAWSLLIVTCVLAGLCECMKRRIGGLLALVLVYKLAISLAFYSYAREAVSILPVAYVFAAIGLKASVARRMQLWNITSPRWGKWLAPVVMIVLVLASISAGWRGWAYQVLGTGDPAPQWGQDAFESHQQLEIQRIAPNQKLSAGYRVG
jgi:hypothetical protein